MQDIIDDPVKQTQADADATEFKEYKRMKREEEARASIAKIECDCLSIYSDKSTLRETCKNAEHLAIGAVVVFPAYVKPCVAFLGKDPKCALIAAISYPFGLDSTEIKVAAVKRAIKDGVDEVEVCAPVQFIRDGNLAYFKRECKKLKRAARNISLRITFDCELFTDAELTKACAIAADAGVHCVRLNGADGDKIAKIKQALRGKCLIKADGVESFATFANYCVMGADYAGSKTACELASYIKRQSEI